jgi:hypothetical protein
MSVSKTAATYPGEDSKIMMVAAVTVTEAKPEPPYSHLAFDLRPRMSNLVENYQKENMGAEIDP